MQNFSPFRHSPALPVEEFDLGAVLILAIIAAGTAAAAASVFRWRDVTN
ncbi:hypothetical protein [Arthrobacter mobilis]|nr:hypothetical protein [Arthrobacter mobilis]